MSASTHDEAHTGPIKTPKQLFWVSMAAFVVPVLIIIGLVSIVTSYNKQAPGATNTAEAVATRLQKVGSIEIRDANRPLATGEAVYKAQCTACHAAGVSGAPKSGDAGAWAPRIAKGYELMLTHALKGFNAMPPQGGGNFSDLEIGRAVVYMANAAGGKLPEPAAPAASGAQAAASPAAPAAPAPAAEAASQPSTAPVAAAAPAAVVTAAPTATPETAKPADTVAGAGKALYDKSCSVCHAAGVAGAPKFGDKAAWAPFIATGMDTMLKIAISGKGAMPPRGGTTATDDELRAAIEYMVEHAK